MPNPHCRIARIRPKDGSAQLYLLQGGPEVRHRDLVAGMRRDVATLTADDVPLIEAYCLITWNACGSSGVLYDVPTTAGFRVDLLQFAAADAIRQCQDEVRGDGVAVLPPDESG